MSRVKSFRLLAVILPLLALPAAAQQESVARAPWRVEEVGDGVTWKQYHFQSLWGRKQNVNVLEADLNNKNVKVRFAAPGGLRRTSAIGAPTEAIAGVNGGFFAAGGAPRGALIIDGKEIPGEPWESERQERSAYLIVDAKDRMTIAAAPSDAWKGAPHVLHAYPILLENGRESSKIKGWGRAIHPRTMIGLTKKNQLILATVDGRTSESTGLSWSDMAKLMQELGCETAANLDGGGSTTMWIRGKPDNGIVNRPCDNKKFDHGGERSVANVVLVYAPTVVMVDNDAAELSPAEQWKTTTRGQGFFGKDFALASPGEGASATWTLKFELKGKYDIFARWPRGGFTGLTDRATLLVGIRQTTISQKKNNGEWVKIGSVSASEGQELKVRLTGSDRSPLAADAVRAVQN